MTTVDRWAAMVPDPHPAANCGPLTFDLPPGHMCPTCGTVVFPASLHASPVQGPVGAPFRPGDRFRWTGDDGTVQTGKILLLSADGVRWVVDVDADERSPRGYRTWFDPDMMVRVP